MLPWTFVGGTRGAWTVTGLTPVRGEGIEPVERIEVVDTWLETPPPGAAWALRGTTSNLRYTTRDEKDRLAAIQAAPGRSRASRAALIPIKKSARWWDLAQDERRRIFEEMSRHTSIGLAYLPAIARLLHHCRDLGEPFDFITWFDFAPEDERAFDALLAELRASEEWAYVEREIDIRLTRA